jgi:hypothetical protein
MTHNHDESVSPSLGVIAMLAAISVLGVVLIMVGVIIPMQQAEARPFSSVKSCDPGFTAFNASQGRCFHP